MCVSSYIPLIDISLDILVTEQIIPQQIVPKLNIAFQMPFQSDGSHYDLQLNTELACL